KLDPIVIHDCHLVVLDRADLSAQKDGKLLFLGEEVDHSDPTNPSATLSVTIKVGGQEIVKSYRRLDRGDPVRPGQLVAMIDPSLALSEYYAAKAKITAATADYESAKAAHAEARARLERLEVLRRTRTVPEEEYSVAVLVKEVKRYEEV